MGGKTEEGRGGKRRGENEGRIDGLKARALTETRTMNVARIATRQRQGVEASRGSG